MRVVKALGLFAANVLWRYLRVRKAGRVLVSSLGSKDATVRTIAGMLLVRAGHRSTPLLREALDKHEHLPIVLTIIADIGDESFVPELRGFLGSGDRNVAESARHALAVLEQQPKSDPAR